MTPLAAGLYLVPTPIGNLGDISERMKTVLQGVACVAAEDTRHSEPLLRLLGVGADRVSVHAHNEQQAASHLIERLARGQAIALISDAGTPAVSDPGARLVKRVREAGYLVCALPGPCAFVTAWSASGVSGDGCLFYGFLPAKTVARKAALTALVSIPFTRIVYESAHRLLASLADMASIFGAEQPLLLAKEISKCHETYVDSTIAGVSAWCESDARHCRGEFVLILPYVAPPVTTDLPADAEKWLQLLLNEPRLSLKTAVDLIAQMGYAGHKALYQRALALQRGSQLNPGDTALP